MILPTRSQTHAHALLTHSHALHTPSLQSFHACTCYSHMHMHAQVGELLGGRAATLLDINEAAALKLLTRNVDVLQPSAVVPGLKVRSWTAMPQSPKP